MADGFGAFEDNVRQACAVARPFLAAALYLQLRAEREVEGKKRSSLPPSRAMLALVSDVHSTVGKLKEPAKLRCEPKHRPTRVFELAGDVQRKACAQYARRELHGEISQPNFIQIMFRETWRSEQKLISPKRAPC